MNNLKAKHALNIAFTVVFAVLAVLYVYPVFMILINSFKAETAISTSTVFQLPTADTFAGAANFVAAVVSQGFLQSFFYTLFITLSSVALILLCCSMCAWYITRINGPVSRAIYYLCVFSMVVPFQMVMFTLAQTADSLKLNTPYNICIIYLGFGAGLAVFMFCGFVKSIPLEIEEAARPPPSTAATRCRPMGSSCCPSSSPPSSRWPSCRPCGCGTTTCCPPWCWTSANTAPSPCSSSTSAAATAGWRWVP